MNIDRAIAIVDEIAEGDQEREAVECIKRTVDVLRRHLTNSHRRYFDIIKDIGEKGLLLDLFGSGEKTAKC